MEDKAKKSTEKKAPPEAVYEASALADAAWKHFDFPPELVETALKLEGKDKFTLTEAKSIVKTFSERKVM
jgi:hypothetical protein